MSADLQDPIQLFGWIQPYQTSDDYTLAVWNPLHGRYELGDGDSYPIDELIRTWSPKWLSWADIEKAIATARSNTK